jgi:hypothetical protein
MKQTERYNVLSSGQIRTFERLGLHRSNILPIRHTAGDTDTNLQCEFQKLRNAVMRINKDRGESSNKLLKSLDKEFCAFVGKIVQRYHTDKEDWYSELPDEVSKPIILSPKIAIDNVQLLRWHCDIISAGTLQCTLLVPSSSCLPTYAYDTFLSTIIFYCACLKDDIYNTIIKIHKANYVAAGNTITVEQWKRYCFLQYANIGKTLGLINRYVEVPRDSGAYKDCRTREQVERALQAKMRSAYEITALMHTWGVDNWEYHTDARFQSAADSVFHRRLLQGHQKLRSMTAGPLVVLGHIKSYLSGLLYFAWSESESVNQNNSRGVAIGLFQALQVGQYVYGYDAHQLYQIGYESAYAFLREELSPTLSGAELEERIRVELQKDKIANVLKLYKTLIDKAKYIETPHVE